MEIRYIRSALVLAVLVSTSAQQWDTLSHRGRYGVDAQLR